MLATQRIVEHRLFGDLTHERDLQPAAAVRHHEIVLHYVLLAQEEIETQSSVSTECTELAPS